MYIIALLLLLLLLLMTMMMTMIIIIHKFHGDTSLKQNFRAAVNVKY